MSPGPGRVESEVSVSLPRPRDVVTPEFNAIRRELSLQLHNHHGRKVA
jgi:NitT/TauT family transport system ATP-binding protein